MTNKCVSYQFYIHDLHMEVLSSPSARLSAEVMKLSEGWSVSPDKGAFHLILREHYVDNYERIPTHSQYCFK